MNPLQPHGHSGPPAERRQCAAKNRAGERCKRFCGYGKVVCHFHGGKTPAGADSPHFVHGRGRRRYPERLQARIDAAEADPELLSRRRDLALIEARLQDLLDRIDRADSGELWASVRDAWNDAKRSKSPAAMAALGALIERGANDDATWRDILTALRTRDRLALGEQKRLMQLQMLLDANDAKAMALFLVDAVKRHVRDPLAVDAIIDDVERYVSGGDSRRAAVLAERVV